MTDTGNRLGEDARDALVRQGLRIPHLRLMAALEETGQISGAASQLAISQPAASRSLAELERIVGGKLYNRHGRGIELTEAGRLLAARAQRILRDLDEAGRTISKLSSGFLGRVDVGAVTGPALEIVMPSIRQMRVTHPEIQIDVHVDTSDKLAEGLAAGRLDFYIGRLLGGLEPSSVELETIGPEPVSLIVRAEHPLVGRASISLADVLPYDWVMQPPGGLLRSTVELYLLERKHPLPSRIVSTTSLLLTLALIGGSNAVAPVARSVAEFYSSTDGLAGRIRELAVARDIQVAPYSIIRPSNEAMTPAARVLHGIVQARSTGLRPAPT